MLHDEAPIRKTPQLVKWGINWKEPALMITFAICGLTGAIGHHLYYHFMDKTLVSSPATQQWALRFGTAFSVFTITMLRAAIVAAYNQYIWKVFRDKSFSVSDMDKIFALTSDFMGFFSLTLIKCGRLVILLASLCWLLPLAGLTPAATMSVVTSLHTETINQSLPTLNFQSEYWRENPFADRDMGKMASILSEEQVMPQLTAPAPNSSYTVQFYGPTFLCEEASVSEQDQHSMALWNESEVFTSLTLQMYNDGTLDVTSEANVSFLILSISALEIGGWQSYNQFWAQTANFSAVCSIANASFEVGIDYLNGAQTISQRNIEIINLIDSVPAEEFTLAEPAYSSIFIGLYHALSGNITVTSSGQTGSFNVANTGLITCHEIFWWLSPEHYNITPIGTNATYDTSMWLPVSEEYSLCRNRSISLAIQDLANNFTISFLGIPGATVNVSTPVTITAPQNIYHYDSRNLLISYAAGIAATIFAVIVGLMAIQSNGVCHSTSFSAIMTSTIGNRQMSDLSRGQSIGAQPLSKMVAEKKIRLGVIKDQDSEAEKDEWGDPISRTGFGLDGTVIKLMKGVKCS